MPQRYLSRALEPELRRAARHFPVVVLTGPRQSGKSTLLAHLFPKHRLVSLDPMDVRHLARRDPQLFLENLGDQVFLDEIQYVPELLPYLKLRVDRDRSRKGFYVLSGSQIFPLMAGISESLAGRAALFELLGFSWEELPKRFLRYTPRDCFTQLWHGFYPDPAVHGTPPGRYYGSYLTTYLERDIRQVRSVQDLGQFQHFLELLAARSGGLLNLNEVARDAGISHTAAKQWLSLLESTRIVYLLRPYFRNVSKRVVKHPKLYFTDTGLLSYLLKYPNPETMLAGPMAGAFFETMVIIEFLKRKFNHGAAYEMYFYRDSNGNEVDLVLDFGQKLLPVEIKLGKTFRPEWAHVFTRLGKMFRGQTGYLLSMAEDEMTLSSNAQALPWWKMDKLLDKNGQ